MKKSILSSLVLVSLAQSSWSTPPQPPSTPPSSAACDQFKTILNELKGKELQISQRMGAQLSDIRTTEIRISDFTESLNSTSRNQLDIRGIWSQRLVRIESLLVRIQEKKEKIEEFRNKIVPLKEKEDNKKLTPEDKATLDNLRNSLNKLKENRIHLKEELKQAFQFRDESMVQTDNILKALIMTRKKYDNFPIGDELLRKFIEARGSNLSTDDTVQDMQAVIQDKNIMLNKLFNTFMAELDTFQNLLRIGLNEGAKVLETLHRAQQNNPQIESYHFVVKGLRIASEAVTMCENSFNMKNELMKLRTANIILSDNLNKTNEDLVDLKNSNANKDIAIDFLSRQQAELITKASRADGLTNELNSTRAALNESNATINSLRVASNSQIEKITNLNEALGEMGLQLSQCSLERKGLEDRMHKIAERLMEAQTMCAIIPTQNPPVYVQPNPQDSTPKPPRP